MSLILPFSRDCLQRARVRDADIAKTLLSRFGSSAAVEEHLNEYLYQHAAPLVAELKKIEKEFEEKKRHLFHRLAKNRSNKK